MPKKIKKPDYGTLSFLYIKKDYTINALASNFGVSRTTIYRWLKSYGIKKEIRTIFIIVLLKTFIKRVIKCLKQMIKILHN